MSFAPGSFRDPDARVLAGDGNEVLRVLSAPAAAFDAELRRAGVLAALERDGLLIASRRCSEPPPAGWAALCATPRLPFVNYPAEWAFSMLQDAALLTLDLTARLLAHGGILKDASAFNVMFAGATPTFIDLGSLAPRADDAPWLAYGQFGDHFLAPLMLEAHTGVPFQPLLRGALTGLPVGQVAALLPATATLRAGVLLHVKARAWLERRTRNLPTAARHDVRAARVPTAAVARNIAGLRRVVAGLRSRAPSTWARYDDANTYDDAQTAQKTAFVAQCAERLGGGQMAWDWGANTGRYSRVLAQHYATVVAMDGDAGAVDRHYRALRGTAQAARILPLVADCMDPPAARGWRGSERSALSARGGPQLAVHLALIHHVCLGQGVPLGEFLDFALGDTPHAIVEFVTRDDPMARAVLATKVVAHADYALDTFRALAVRRGRVLDEVALSDTRHLFLLERGAPV